MSTDDRRGGRTRRRRRRFLAAFAVVAGVLLVAVLGGAAVAIGQGPRVTDVDVDPAAASTTSGSRIILTTSERLDPVDPAQVTVTPAAPFTVDTSGRSVGVRFTLPLDDDTEYTVRIADAVGAGGGPSATLETAFRTPAAEVYLLRRSTDGDAVFRTGLAGTAAVPVYSAPHIEDFRATATHLVVVVRGDQDLSTLVVTDPDGGRARNLPLPGEGYVSNLQSADRGERVGYTFDSSLAATDGAESALYTASLRDGDGADPPERVAVTGVDARVADWRFVPDTDRILLLSFDGSLLLSGASGAGTYLGTASLIEGIARGSSVAIIDRADGFRALDLASGADAELVPADVPGLLSQVTPLPGGGPAGAAGTIRSYGLVGDGGVALGTTVARVADDGVPTTLMSVPGSDSVLQTCVSPSGRYAAVLVAPSVVSNPYDGYRLPLPATVQTRIVEVATGHEVSALQGFGISWCRVPPR